MSKKRMGIIQNLHFYLSVKIYPTRYWPSFCIFEEDLGWGRPLSLYDFFICFIRRYQLSRVWGWVFNFGPLYGREDRPLSVIHKPVWCTKCLFRFSSTTNQLEVLYEYMWTRGLMGRTWSGVFFLSLLSYVYANKFRYFGTKHFFQIIVTYVIPILISKKNNILDFFQRGMRKHLWPLS